MSNCTLFDDAPTPKPADLTKPVDGVGCGCGCDSFACSPLNAVAPVDRVAPLVVVAELPVGSSSSHWLNKANVVKWLQAQSECVLFEAASLQPSVSQSLRARLLRAAGDEASGCAGERANDERDREGKAR